MDGLTLAASVAELQCLAGGRIEKIQQPEKYELLFSVHAAGGNYRLLISSSTENCRIQLTEEKRPSPIDAPNFLMLLRKHLTGARIVSIEQPNLDRIALIRFDALTELHDKTDFTLACEIMGKYSNVILVDADGMILDALRRVSASMSSVRLVLPRIPYELPAIQEKIDPRHVTAEQIRSKLIASVRPEKALSALIYGLSPTVAVFVIEHLENKLQNGALWLKQGEYSAMDREQRFEALSEAITDFYDDLLSLRETPCIIKRGERSILLPFTPTNSDFKSFSSISEAADEFYRQRAEAESVKRRTASLERVLENNIQRLERKAEKFSLSIGDEAEIDRLRLFGELLTANLYAIHSPCREAVVSNYYTDPPEPVTIPLDETRSVSDNAQQYYKKYRKARSAREIAIVKLDETMRELEYLQGVRQDLMLCTTDSDFDEIRLELVQGGYIRDNQKKRQKLPQAKPHRYISSDGFEILVGKNNTQNDRVTFREAAADDIWLHTKDVHGSHVIIRCSGQDVPDSTLHEASVLASYYSQARNAPSVQVDYTKRRFVKKPNGAKPGMVIYTNQKTIVVAPDEELIFALSRKR